VTFFVTGGGGGRGQELIFLGTDVCIVLFITFLTSCPTPAIGGVILSSVAIEAHSLLRQKFLPFLQGGHARTRRRNMISTLTVNTRARFSFLCVVKARLSFRDVVVLFPHSIDIFPFL